MASIVVFLTQLAWRVEVAMSSTLAMSIAVCLDDVFPYLDTTLCWKDLPDAPLTMAEVVLDP